MAQILTFTSPAPRPASFSPLPHSPLPTELFLNSFAVSLPSGEDLYLFHQKQAQARQQAGVFYQILKHGKSSELPELKPILRQVRAQSVERSFERALLQIAASQGQCYTSLNELLSSRFGKNGLQAFFNSAQQKSLMRLLYPGQPAFYSTPWENRRYGMWRSIANFIEVCKKHPLMSATVIGSVGYLGHRFPFLGGVSGIGIVGWGGLVSLFQEAGAKQLPAQSAEQAERYQISGENMAAVLITLLGVKGIWNGTLNGYQQAVQKTSGLASGVNKYFKGVFAAIKARPDAQHKTNILESFLFVSGLFDNVLLPFNALADKLSDK